MLEPDSVLLPSFTTPSFLLHRASLLASSFVLLSLFSVRVGRQKADSDFCQRQDTRPLSSSLLHFLRDFITKKVMKTCGRHAGKIKDISR